MSVFDPRVWLACLVLWLCIGIVVVTILHFT